MRAIEWWPTRPDKNGIPRPRIIITGPCGECGTQVTRVGVPYQVESTEACSTGCRKKITRRERAAGTLYPEVRPCPWTRGEEFDAWLVGGFAAVNAIRSTVARNAPAPKVAPTQAAAETVARRRDGMDEQVQVIGRGVAKRCLVGDVADADRLLSTLPEDRRVEALAVAEKVMAGRQKTAPTLDEIAYAAGLKLAKKWAKGNEVAALAVLEGVTESRRDQVIRMAKVHLRKWGKTRPVAPEAVEPEPALVEPVGPTEKQIAAYQVYRVAVSKSPRPIVEEARRRAMCVQPTKVAYEDNPLGRAAAEWHADDLRKLPDGETVDVYRCTCGHIHVGHNRLGLVNMASRRVG